MRWRRGRRSLAASNADPCTIIAANDFSNNDWVVIEGVGGTTQLNSGTYIVQARTSSSFIITDLNGVAINSSAFGVYTSGGTVSRIFTLVTPWLASDLPLLKYTQSDPM